MGRRSSGGSCRLFALVVAGDGVKVAMPVEVDFDGLPVIVGHVAEESPGGIGLGLIGDVKAEHGRVAALKL